MRSRALTVRGLGLLLPLVTTRRFLAASAAVSRPQMAAPVLRLGRSDVPATASVLLLHGLGDSAQGIRGIVPFMAEAVPHARFVLPTAPVRPITMNGGFEMTGWYDIVGLSERENENAEGLDDAIDSVKGLIEEEISRGVPASRIVVTGFSQGGALSLWTGLTREGGDALAGVVSMSGYLPRATTFALSESGGQTKTLMCHGEDDPLVLYEFGKASEALLREQGVQDLTFKSYPGLAHSLNEEELADVGAFLAEVIPPLEGSSEL